MQFSLTSICASACSSAASRYCGVGLIAVASVLSSAPALADPALNAPSFSQTTAGSVATTVPDGTCAAVTATRGGAGASSGTTAALGGRGAGGALINARFSVLPGQAVTGTVAAGGQIASNLTAPNNGTGAANGGSGGTAVATLHRGGGGGGSTAFSIAGLKLVEAGGGGGGGAAHQAVPAGAGGGGGFAGIAAGLAVPGVDGTNGTDGTATIQGGRGGLASAGGAGGTNSANASFNGFAGQGIGTGTGGNGGVDTTTDTGGGGGGGYTGGGGGASTVNSSITGGGGGGGSSFLRGTSPTVTAAAPTAVSSAAGPAPAGGAVAGAAGLLTIDWVPCVYTLSINKSVSATSVNAGQSVRWTITVANGGPDAMTKGDIVTLADTLPVGGGSTFQVVSLATTGGSTDPNLTSGAITCTGVTVGGTMPGSTDCSRVYSAPAAPGAPSGGTRGLNSGETLTIVYDQIFNNAIPAASVSNVAMTVDRASTTGTTDLIGVNATRTSTAATSVLPYDLRVTKAASSATVGVTDTMTWTVNVTNLGPGGMFGPDAAVANPLVVSDIAPTTNVSAPASFTSTGPAGTCTYASNTINCTGGLGLNQTQVFTFQQTVNGAAPMNAVVSNTASVTDYFAGDTNDSAGASFTVTPSSNLTTSKTRTSASATPAVGDTVSYQITVINNGPSVATNVSLTDLLPVGLTAAAGNGAVSQGSYASGTGLWTIGSLANGASATLALVGTVNPGQGGQTISNTTTAASSPDQADPTPAGDDLIENVTVTLPVLVANPDTATGINGAAGQSNVVGVLANDTIDTVQATTANVLTSVITAASNPGVALNTATGFVSVAAGTPAGTYTIGYRICDILNTAICADSTATITINPSADLTIVKSNGVSTVNPGGVVTYSVVVTNSGPDAVTGAVITDAVGAGLTCPGANAVTITGTGVPAGSFTIANVTGAGITLGALPSGQAATLTYSCQVN